MPDIMIRHIDDALAERIKELARARGWTINDVVLHVLRHGLGLAHGDTVWLQAADVSHLTPTLRSEEARAFQSAMDALEDVPDGSFGHTGDGEEPDT